MVSLVHVLDEVREALQTRSRAYRDPCATEKKRPCDCLAHSGDEPEWSDRQLQVQAWQTYSPCRSQHRFDAVPANTVVALSS